MALKIRRITNVDQTIAAAFVRLLPQLTSAYPAPSEESLQAIASSPSSALFAACDGEHIVGTLTLAWYDTPTGRKAWIEDVVVDAAARGLGAGEALVLAALDHARQVGAGRVMLTSRNVRQAAQALYRKVGFEEAETSVFVFKIE